MYTSEPNGVHTMSITMQLSTIILRFLKDRQGKVHIHELLRLVNQYYFSSMDGAVPSEREVRHAIDLLVEDSLVIRTHNGAWEEFQISNKGYGKLRAWYAPKRLASIMSNDFAEVLSIVATILSIFATYLSIKSRY